MSPRVSRKNKHGRKAAPNETAATKAQRTKSTREKVQAFRERMRTNGFRLIQMWLPDTRTAKFARQAHIQSLRASHSPTAKIDQANIDSISWWNAEEAAELEKSEPPAPWWHEPE